MNTDKVSIDQTALCNKLARLEAVNRNMTSALEKVASLCDFQACNKADNTPYVNLLATAAQSAGQMIKFKACSFYVIDEESSDFTLAYSTCTNQSKLLDDEMDRLINNKIINWAINRKKVTIIKSNINGETILMQPIATATRLRGFFISFLGENANKIEDYRIDLLSIIIFKLANSIESYSIYDWNNKINKNFHSKIDKLSITTSELDHYRENLELIVEERTVKLKNINHKLKEEVQERLKIQKQLLKIQLELEDRVAERTDELEKMQGQMIIHEKLAAIGQLSAGVAHEFNNPINFIRTNFSCLKSYFFDLLDLLKFYARLERRCVENSNFQCLTKLIQQKKIAIHNALITREIPDIFKESEIGFKRIDNIIKVMMSFSRNGTQETPVYFNLNQIINETSALSLTLFQSVVEFTTELENIPAILGFPGLIKDVLLNIFLNSIQAFETQDRERIGMITVKTWHEQNAILCTISDNGPGILKKDQLYIFDPFYTTKAPGKGRGLGLSTAYDVITNKHQGKLTVDCPRNGGTVFTLHLPLAACQKEHENAGET